MSYISDSRKVKEVTQRYKKCHTATGGKSTTVTSTKVTNTETINKHIQVKYLVQGSNQQFNKHNPT